MIVDRFDIFPFDALEHLGQKTCILPGDALVRCLRRVRCLRLRLVRTDAAHPTGREADRHAQHEDRDIPRFDAHRRESIRAGTGRRQPVASIKEVA